MVRLEKVCHPSSISTQFHIITISLQGKSIYSRFENLSLIWEKMTKNMKEYQ